MTFFVSICLEVRKKNIIGALFISFCDFQQGYYKIEQEKMFYLCKNAFGALNRIDLAAADYANNYLKPGKASILKRKLVM